MVLAVLFAEAAHAELPELTPVTASYKVTVNGIPVGTAATIAVQPLADGRHEASFNVQNRFLRHHEVSRFDWKSCRITPREYLHEFTGLGIERQSALTFDPVHALAIETRGGKRLEIPLASDVTDALNMAMLARCRLRDGSRLFDLPVIYRGERKDLSFRVAGEERVATPFGAFDAVIVERQYPQGGRRTRVWVAPTLDWFMVRFEHVENPVARGSMVLTDFRSGAPHTAAVPLKSHSPHTESIP